MADKTDIYPPGVELRDWEDFGSLRKNIMHGMRDTVAKQFPVTYGGVRLELHDLDYDDEEPYGLDEQKETIMKGGYLHKKLRGTFRLFDEKTGDLLDEKQQTVMKVPWLTDRGTFIHGGNEYATIHQARLLPGAYTRRKDSGELETHFNAKRGSGHSFRVRLEPDTGLFKLDIGQASLRLYSLLKDIGVPDEQLEKQWGPEVLKANQDGYDRRVFEKSYQRLVRRPDPAAGSEDKVKAIHQALGDTRLDYFTVQKTLPNLLQRKMASAFQAGGQTGAVQGTNGSTPESGTAPGYVDPAFMEPPDVQPDSEGGVSKQDLLLVAMFLNEKFKAGIPLEQSLGELADDVSAFINEQTPGLMPEVAAGLSGDVRKSAAVIRSKKQLDREAHRAATSPKNRQQLPTKPQKHSGNYRKGHIRLHGFDIAIENPKSSVRKGTAQDGARWSITMRAHYGYIKRTEGNDGDHLDCFIGRDLDTDNVFVVNQINPKTGLFDEHKVLFGYPTLEAAREGYLQNYQPGWRGLGSISRFDVNEFRELLPDLDLTKPIKS